MSWWKIVGRAELCDYVQRSRSGSSSECFQVPPCGISRNFFVARRSGSSGPILATIYEVDEPHEWNHVAAPGPEGPPTALIDTAAHQ